MLLSHNWADFLLTDPCLAPSHCFGLCLLLPYPPWHFPRSPTSAKLSLKLNVRDQWFSDCSTGTPQRDMSLTWDVLQEPSVLAKQTSCIRLSGV